MSLQVQPHAGYHQVKYQFVLTFSLMFHAYTCLCMRVFAAFYAK